MIRVYEKTAARNGFRFFGNVEVGDHVSAAELAEPLPRRHLCVRSVHRPSPRDPRRGARRFACGHRVRRLVQRPPRLRRSRVRPLVRTGGGDRKRQRRHRRRADAGAHAPRARGDRHREPRDRPARRLRRARDRHPGAPRAGAGGVHEPGAPRARRDAGRRRRSRSRRDGARRPEPRVPGVRRGGHHDPQERRDLHGVLADASPRASASASCCGSFARRSRSTATARWSAWSSARNELYRDDSGAIRARDTGERETIECGLVLRSIGYAGVGLEGVPFDERRAVIPNQGGRVTEPEGGEQVLGQYAVGWIKRGPSGVIGTNKKDAQETVDNLLEDARAGRVPNAAIWPTDRSAIVELLAERTPDSVTLCGVGGDRPGRARARRAARPPAGEVRAHRRDARGGSGTACRAGRGWLTSPRSSG